MRRLLLTLLLLLPLALPLSCGESSDDQSIVTGDFVVRFDPSFPSGNPNGSGCWKLVATDNFIYGPTNLDNVYQIDGLRVHASLQLSHLPMAPCGGANVEIIEIAPLP